MNVCPRSFRLIAARPGIQPVPAGKQFQSSPRKTRRNDPGVRSSTPQLRRGCRGPSSAGVVHATASNHPGSSHCKSPSHVRDTTSITFCGVFMNVLMIGHKPLRDAINSRSRPCGPVTNELLWMMSHAVRQFAVLDLFGRHDREEN